jgi:sugar lactone lactonase YvrE
MLNKNSGAVDLVINPEPGKPQNRYNDTRCDVRGRVFTSTVAKTYGTPNYTPDQRGAFYMIEKNGKVTVIEDNINQYNGIVWSPDGKKLYVADTFNNTLLEWDYDPDKGPVGKSRVVIDFNGRQGMPDGLNVDVEGNIYVSHWTGRISIWGKNFKLKEEIKFPVEQACCGGFAGGDLKDYYVATARYAYTEEQLKNRNGAGGIFLARSSVQGVADNLY